VRERSVPSASTTFSRHSRHPAAGVKDTDCAAFIQYSCADRNSFAG